MKKFETGKIYKMSWIGDSDLLTLFKVIKRTEKTITIKEFGTEKIKTCRLSPYFLSQNKEVVKPMGTYSMCPLLYAEDVAKVRG